MKTKFLQVYDDWTHLQFLLIQIEELDLPKLIKRKFPIGFKIIIDLSESKVAATSGVKFYPEYGEGMADSSRKLTSDGTKEALGLFLNSVDDITSLPSEVNVKNIREMRRSLNQKRINGELEEEGIYLEEGHYKKVLYKNFFNTESLAIIDDALNLVFGKTGGRSLKADYHWLPCDKLEKESFNDFLNNNDLPNNYKQISV